MEKFKDKKWEWLVVAIYTFLNLKITWPLLFGSYAEGLRVAAILNTNGTGSGVSILAILLSLFLNAAMVLYVIKCRKGEHL